MKGLGALVGAAAIPDGTGNWIPVISCGLKAEVGKFTLVNDFYSQAWDNGFMDILSDGMSISYRHNDQWNFSGHFIIDYYQLIPDPSADYHMGVVCEYTTSSQSSVTAAPWPSRPVWKASAACTA